MSIYIDVLGSGSSGNCYLMTYDNTAIFVDAGTTKKNLSKVLNKVSDKKTYLFITHEHSDHIKGLKFFLQNIDLEIFCSYGTAKYLYKLEYDPDKIKVINSKTKYLFNSFSVLPFNTYHDGNETLAYRFSLNYGDITFLTDTGTIDKGILDAIDGTNALFLESNYEEQMLLNGNYPLHLKKRILSSKGHLSNKEAIKTVHEIYGNRLKNIFLSHISEENNSYALVEKYSVYIEKNLKIETTFLKQKQTYNFKLF
ncbi:MAG: MBL fold metallo-hydrolase [Deferribacterales bacterium]